MLSEPRVEQRAAQPYAAIRKQVTMQELGTVLPPLGDEVVQWLAKQGISPAGAPFFRYLTMDMEADQFQVDVGWPLAEPVIGDGAIIAGELPAGRYGVILNTGPYSDLARAHGALLAWGEKNGITWQTSEDGRSWGVRMESYETDPAEEPDPQKWETEVRFLMRTA